MRERPLDTGVFMIEPVTMFQPTRPPVKWSRVDMRRANRYGG
jgi:hypothetical protein